MELTILPMLNLAGLGIAFHATNRKKRKRRKFISSLGLDGFYIY
jgi:phosphoserine phosphatase